MAYSSVLLGYETKPFIIPLLFVGLSALICVWHLSYLHMSNLLMMRTSHKCEWLKPSLLQGLLVAILYCFLNQEVSTSHSQAFTITFSTIHTDNLQLCCIINLCTQIICQWGVSGLELSGLNTQNNLPLLFPSLHKGRTPSTYVPTKAPQSEGNTSV